jgi:hypothetical protein
MIDQEMKYDEALQLAAKCHEMGASNRAPMIVASERKVRSLGVHLFDKCEYLLIYGLNIPYWEILVVSGCTRQGLQWFLLVSRVTAVRAGRGRADVPLRVPRVLGPFPG